MYTQKALKDLGFEMTDSKANFIFVKHPQYDAQKLFLQLRRERYTGALFLSTKNWAIFKNNNRHNGTNENIEIIVAINSGYGKLNSFIVT